MKLLRPIVPVLLILAAGCGSRAQVSRHLRPETEAPPEAWKGIATIAIMPPDNWTLRVGWEYAAWFRAVIADLLREKGYLVTPLVDVNRFLIRNRFSLAGEVVQYEMEELTAALRCDAVLFWDITGEGPKLNVALLKSDRTMLWSTGEVVLGLPYRYQSREPVDGEYRDFAMTLAETLHQIPVRS